LISLIACSASEYKRSADEEVAGIIQQKQAAAGFTEDPISVEFPEDTLRKRLLERLEELKMEARIEGSLPDLPPSGPKVQEPIYPEGSDRGEPVVLSLQECLAAAAENSREYRREKENVYLAALNLTLERHSFRNNYFGTLSGDIGQTGPEERSGSVSADTGFTRNLASGGRIVFDIGATLFRAFTGGADDLAEAFMDLTITQPLLRGAGRDVALEPLTQAERDALYAIRSFEHFKRTLAVQVASSMYQVLQAADAVRNARTNYDSVTSTRVQTEELAKAGRSPEFEVDQARDRELRAREGWIRQIEAYNSRLDRFKITLGLPTDANILIEEDELTALRDEGLIPLHLDAENAVDFALDYRLDLMNTRDEVDDAERRVNVTRNALLAGLDLSFRSSVTNKDNQLFAYQFGNGRYILGADVDLPFDRTAERNAYRSSLISYERAKRTYDGSEDNVKLEVREGVRNLKEAEESYAIQVAALDLSTRRVDSTTLLQQAGRATTRDILDSQQALLESQDGVTAALITHTIARLELLRDLDLLTVDQEGLSYDAGTFRFPKTSL